MLGSFKAIAVGLVVEHGLVDLLFSVKDEGPVLDDGLVEGLACDDD